MAEPAAIARTVLTELAARGAALGSGDPGHQPAVA